MTPALNLRDVAIGLLVALCLTLPTLAHSF
jgi:hypothetical protein